VKIVNVTANNRRKAFEIATRSEVFVFPYTQLRVKPTAEDRVVEVYADPELGHEAFTYALESGREDSVHLDEVREYNRDPGMLRNLLLYRLTREAQKRVAASGLSRREIIRRLGTSASQFYRLLDQTNTGKSIGQLAALLDILGCDVDVVVRKRARRSA
jgi:hypothetical protein